MRGVITAVRPDIPFTINDFVNIGIPDHHVCDITIHLKKTKLRVINVYKSPSSNARINLRPLLVSPVPIMICGDFNARHIMWDPTMTNRSGNILANHITDVSAFHVLNDRSPTYIAGSALDLTLVSNSLASACQWRTSDVLLSDHHAIEVTIHDTAKKTQITQTGAWNISKMNWGLYNKNLETILDNSPPADSLEGEAVLLDNIINEALIKTTRKNKVGVKRPFRPTWQYDQEYRQLKREQNRLTKQFLTHRDNGTLLAVRRSQKALLKITRKAKEKTWLDWCEKLQHNTPIGDMWKKLKSIEGKPAAASPHPDPHAEANRLVEGYATRARSSQLPKEVLDRQRQLKSARLRSLRQMSKIPDPSTDRPFSTSELTTALTKKKNTAPGENGIVYRVLQNSSPVLWVRLLDLFNRSWLEGHLPAQWKDAIIHCIPKPADPTNPRPISLLSVIDKLMESMVLPRLLWKIGSPHRDVRGFTQGRSTQDCITYVLANLSEHYNKTQKYKPVAIFLDLEKAFELASRLAVTELLINKGVKGRMLSWLADYLHERSAKVRYQGILSQSLRFENGTPQGSVLSPTLFNLLMEDIVRQPYHCATKVLSYADDLVLVSTIPSQSSLDRDLQIIENRCEYLGLKISAEKSRAMSIRTMNNAPFHLELQGRPLEWESEYKYLGITIDRKLKMSKHMNILKNRIVARLNIMRRLTARHSGATFKVLNAYYVGAIRSIIEYSAPATLLMSNSAVQQLDVLQSRALRIATRSYTWVSGAALNYITNTEPLHARRQKTVLKIIDKTLRDLTHPNQEALYAVINGFAIPKNPKSWNAAALALWRTARLPIPDSFEPQYRAPWELDKVTLITNLPDTQKSECCPDQLRSMAYETISTYTQPGDITIYTDGSLDPVTNRAGCGIVIRNDGHTIKLARRVNNLASSLQTELLAIYFALDMVQEYSAHVNTIIITDSLAAIQTIKNNKVTDNVQIVHSIKDLLAECHAVTFIWVPSHVGIKGNELADKLAKQSLSKKKRYTDLPSISISRQRTNIHRHAEDVTLTHMLTKADESPTFAQMAERTKLIPPLKIPTSAPDIRCFAYVMLGYKHPKQQPFICTDRTCPDCDCLFSIEHHFFECAQHMDAAAEMAIDGASSAEKYAALTELSLRNPAPLLQFCKLHPIP